MYLHEMLDEYGNSGRYPMHMPGHKRQTGEAPYDRDITEIEGFDNLYHAEGILKEEMDRAAAVFGAGEARFLVNGSTCGVLAAISAVTAYGDTILMGRNAHKSAYHAVALRGLQAEYVYPDASLYQSFGIDGPVRADEVRKFLETANVGWAAVFLTSPTYEGVISDVGEIAAVCHAHGVPLIVDAAHGAHLRAMGADVNRGADLVILGLHKTLPVLTQCALLAVSRDAIESGRVSMKALDSCLGIYESSSPSYVLMGSISRCIHWLDGGERIGGRTVTESARRYDEMLRKTREELHRMKHFRLFDGICDEKKAISVAEAGKESTPYFGKCVSEYKMDPGKLVISTRGSGITGNELAQRLRDSYEMEIEMAQADYILAMTSMFDTEEGMERFAAALLAVDGKLESEANTKSDEKRTEEAVFPRARTAMTIADALSLARRHPEWVREGKISDIAEKGYLSAEFIYVYPPGIPIAAPGEIITKGVAKKILSDYNSGCALVGCEEREQDLFVKYLQPERQA